MAKRSTKRSSKKCKSGLIFLRSIKRCVKKCKKSQRRSPKTHRCKKRRS